MFLWFEGWNDLIYIGPLFLFSEKCKTQIGPHELAAAFPPVFLSGNEHWMIISHLFCTTHLAPIIYYIISNIISNIIISGIYIYTVEAWTMHGLVLLIPSAPENPHLTFDPPKCNY